MSKVHFRGRSRINSTSSGRPSPAAIGQIFNDNFSSGSLSNYTRSGSSGISSTGNGLDLTGGTGDFTKTIQYTESSSIYKLHCYEKWRQKVRFTSPTLSGTTYGFGVGVKSSNGFDKLDLCIRLSLDTGFQGQYFIYNLVNGSSNQNVQGNSTIASTTTYILIVERNKNVITCTLRNSADTATISTTTYTYNISTYTGSNTFSHNMGSFCIWNFGGDFKILSWQTEVLVERNVDVVFDGDSNMHGLFSTANNLRYCEQSAIATDLTFEVIAGIDAGTTELLALVPTIIDLNPRIVYANCFSNPIARGVLAATYQSEYTQAVALLKARGIKVIHGTPVARGYDFATLLESFLSSTYPSDQVVKLYQETKAVATTALNATYDSGDHIHGNLAMNNICDDKLTLALNAV